MNWRRKLTQDWRSGVTGALLSAVLGLIFLVFPVGRGLSDLSYDLLFLFRGQVKVEEVVMVYMDEASHRELEQPYDRPWSRALHAQLIERLAAAGARAIAFDILFDKPRTNSVEERLADAALVKATREYGRVVLAGSVLVENLPGGLTAPQVSPPFEALRTHASWGLVERAREGDPIIREHFLGASDQPSMVQRVAQLTLTNPPPKIPARKRWVNYYGPPLKSFSYQSFWQVISNYVAPSQFSNKVVFVGAHPGVIGFTAGRSDYFKTPYTHWTKDLSPGVEINATTYANLLRGDSLRLMPPMTEAMFFALIAALFGFGLIGFRPNVALAAALAGILGVFGMAVLLFWTKNLWFSWVTIALIQIPTAFVFAAVSHSSQLRLEKAVLEAQLATARATASAQAGPRPPAAAYADKPTRAAEPAAAAGPAGVLPHTPGLSSFFNSPGVSPEMAARAAAAAASGQLPPPFIPNHTLLRRVGKGAYGEVWLARDIIGTHHAVKVVYRSSFEDPAPYEREFNGIKKFTPISRSHPGFVQILHVGRDDSIGCIYYIMEVGDDESIGQKIDPANYSPKNLAKELRRRGRLPMHECLELALALASALDHLHTCKLIHRDIKPSNIIFVSDAPKFADIGLVTEVAGTGRDVTFLGTKGYIAPEGPGTPAADVYSLGKVIYEASMGLELDRYPELPTTLVEKADAEEVFELNNIILKACEPDIQKRYRSAADLHADLARLKTRFPLPGQG